MRLFAVSSTDMPVFRGVAPWHCAKGLTPQRPRNGVVIATTYDKSIDQTHQFSSP